MKLGRRNFKNEIPEGSNQNARRDNLEKLEKITVRSSKAQALNDQKITFDMLMGEMASIEGDFSKIIPEMNLLN